MKAIINKAILSTYFYKVVFTCAAMTTTPLKRRTPDLNPPFFKCLAGSEEIKCHGVPHSNPVSYDSPEEEDQTL